MRGFNNLNSEEGYRFLDFSEDASIVSEQFDRLGLSVKELLEPPVQAKIQNLEQEVQTERQRAEKLAQRLREMGVNPDEID